MSEADSQIASDTAPAPIGTDSHNVIHVPNIGAVALPKNIPQDMQESTLGHLYSLWDKGTSAISNTLGFSKTANTNTPVAPAPAKPEGMLEPGNIDLAHRPVVHNADGSISSVRSMSFGDDKGREILVPTVKADGSGLMSNAEAKAEYYKTGKHLGIFNSPEAADAYSIQLHNDYAAGKYGQQYNPSTYALPYNLTASTQKQQPVSPASHTVVAVPGVGLIGFPKSVPMPMIESTLGHLYSRLTNAPPILSDAAAAITEDTRGLLPADITDVNSPEFKEAESRMRAGLPPVPDIMEAERTREYDEQQAGYSKPYRLAAHAASVLGTNVAGMEASAKAGSSGGVLGHAAFVPAQMAAGEVVGHALPQAGELIRNEAGELKVPFTGKGGERVGQRVPTSVNAAQGHNPELIVGMDAIRDAAAENPEYLSKLASKLNYPAMKYEKGLTPEAKLKSFIKQAAGNIEWLHNRVPEDIRDVSKGWYDSAHSMTKKWAKDNGYTHEQTAGVTAVLSPQNPWDNNISLAQRVIDSMKNRQDFNWTPEMEKTASAIGKQSFNLNKYAPMVRGKSLSELQHANPEMQNTMKAMWIRIYDEAHNPRAFDRWAPDGSNRGTALTSTGKPANASWFSLDPIAKAVSILEDGSMDNIHERLGSQHKVRNFYNNIIEPNSTKGDTTIDTYAVAVAHLSPLGLSSDEVTHNFGGTSHAGQGLNGTYPLYAEAYRQAAKKLGILPRELQSITWEGIRSLFTQKTPEIQAQVKQVWQQYQQGKITLNQARQKIVKAAGGFKSPDWQTTPAPQKPAWMTGVRDALTPKEETKKPIAENAPSWKAGVMSLAPRAV